MKRKPQTSNATKPSSVPTINPRALQALFRFAPWLAKILLYCEIITRAATTKVKDARTRTYEAALQAAVHKLYVGKDAKLPAVMKNVVAVGCALLTTDSKLARMMFAVRTVVAKRAVSTIQKLPIWKDIVELATAPGTHYIVIAQTGTKIVRLKLDPFYVVWRKIITERYAQLPKPAGLPSLTVEKQIHVLATILSAYCAYMVALMYYLGSSDKAGLLLTTLIGDRDGSNIDYILMDLMNEDCCRKILACVRRHGADTAGHNIRMEELKTDLMVKILNGAAGGFAQEFPGPTEEHAVNSVVRWLSDGLTGVVRTAASRERMQKAIKRHAEEIQETIKNIDADAEGESSSSAEPAKKPEKTRKPMTSRTAADSWNDLEELHTSLEKENGAGAIEQTQALTEQRAKRDAILTKEDVAVQLDITTETLRDKIKKGEFPPEPKRGFTNEYVERCRILMNMTFNKSEAARLLAARTGTKAEACRKWLQRNADKCPPGPDGKFQPSTIRLAATLMPKKPQQKMPNTKPTGGGKKAKK